MSNPFDFFNSNLYQNFTRDLCTDGWPAGVIAVNQAVRDCKLAYEKLEQENERLKNHLKSVRIESEEFQSKRILEWIKTDNQANIAFTQGPTRNIAYAVECIKRENEKLKEQAEKDKVYIEEILKGSDSHYRQAMINGAKAIELKEENEELKEGINELIFAYFNPCDLDFDLVADKVEKLLLKEGE